MITTEEKAQAYDKVVNKLKRFIAQGVDPLITSADVQDFFPELKESEDERIRKRLIELVKELRKLNPTNADHNAECSESIAWLEKQGEQKSVADFSELRTWKYIVDAVWTEKEGIGQYLDSPFTEEVARKLQKRFGNIEQKSADLPNGEDYGIDGLYAAIDILQKALGKVEGYQTDDGILEHECAISAVKELSKHKTAWSEEDEKRIKSITALLKEPAVCAMDGNKGIIEANIKYLKTLKNRVQPQPKQEWSEEDELHIRELESLVKKVWAIAEHEDDKETIHKMSDLSFFLKTLKPKSHWKPSDEQIEVLKEAVEEWDGYKEYKTLNSLYEDLQKL